MWEWKTFLKSVNIWQSYNQERGCLMHFACMTNTLLKDEEGDACFADIKVSQGSVSTYARCDGIFNIHLTVNLPRTFQWCFFFKIG